MNERHATRRVTFCAVAIALTTFGAVGARAANCFAPLAANDKWACTAELSTGESVSYCLNLMTSSGSGATRSFETVATGPYARTCTCGAKGEAPSTLFNAGSSYLCFDESMPIAEIGKISRRKIVGETYDSSANVRSTFKCKVDATCAVVLP